MTKQHLEKLYMLIMASDCVADTLDVKELVELALDGLQARERQMEYDQNNTYHNMVVEKE